MRARSISFAVAALVFVSPAAAAKPHRSMRTAEERKTLFVLDQLERDQARRREQIALFQADAEQHDRTNRALLLGAVGIAGVVIVVARKKKSD